MDALLSKDVALRSLSEHRWGDGGSGRKRIVGILVLACPPTGIVDVGPNLRSRWGTKRHCLLLTAANEGRSTGRVSLLQGGLLRPKILGGGQQRVFTMALFGQLLLLLQGQLRCQPGFGNVRVDCAPTGDEATSNKSARSRDLELGVFFINSEVNVLNLCYLCVF